MKIVIIKDPSGDRAKIETMRFTVKKQGIAERMNNNFLMNFIFLIISFPTI